MRWLLLTALLLNGIFGSTISAASEKDGLVAACLGKKILWVDSYHAEYEWSQGIERGIREALSGSGVELQVWHMDTKRNKSAAFGREAGLQALAAIQKFQPDLVIASDDNAQKYLVVPYLKDTDRVVVVCGVNRDIGFYGYPCANVTGMQETDYQQALTQQMRRFAGGERVGILAGNTETMRAIVENIASYYPAGCLRIYLVDTFEQYKQAFLRAQQEVDMLHVYNNAGIQGWNSKAVETFLLANIRIPTGSVFPWMKSFVIFSLAKLSEEQGEYAAITALNILGGIRPEDIVLKQNSRAHLTVNLEMAQAAGIVVPVSLLQMAEIIGLEALQPINQTSETKGKANE